MGKITLAKLPFPWSDESQKWEEKQTNKLVQQRKDDGKTVQQPSRRSGSATKETTANVVRALSLIVKKYRLVKMKIGPAMGLSESFCNNLFRRASSRTHQRMNEENIQKIASLFGLTTEELCGLTEDNFDEFRPKIVLSKSFEELKSDKRKRKRKKGW